MAILKFILFIVLFYYLAKSITRLVFPYLLKNLNDKMNFSNNTYDNKEKEGDISIKVNKKEGKIDKDIGEYTDYEELDD